ncbi:hypothetical protein RJ640_015719 [Escallonia rubra]|uniref:GAG-pre-integrase domain-containing protein n=1 Tax=Escallonia rubra TaxID=112253 RepID=A0AA88UPJ0_9ASTE|nr:hypothetical protein RJ640_015719 [Escallonia rubra]
MLDFKILLSPNLVNGAKSFGVAIDPSRHLWFRASVPNTAQQHGVKIPIVVFFHSGAIIGKRMKSCATDFEDNFGRGGLRQLLARTRSLLTLGRFEKLPLQTLCSLPWAKWHHVHTLGRMKTCPWALGKRGAEPQDLVNEHFIPEEQSLDWMIAAREIRSSDQQINIATYGSDSPIFPLSPLFFLFFSLRPAFILPGPLSLDCVKFQPVAHRTGLRFIGLLGPVSFSAGVQTIRQLSAITADGFNQTHNKGATYQFLMDLDDKYATFRTQIINMDLFPTIDRVYAMVMHEESHWRITGSRPKWAAYCMVSWPCFSHCRGPGPYTYRTALGRRRGRGSPAMSQNAVGSSSGPLQASAAVTQNNNLSLSQAQATATFALPGLTPEDMQRLITFLESSPSGTDSLVATDTNCFVAFSHDICVLQDRTSKSPIGLDKMHRGVFVFQPLYTTTMAAVSKSESYELWHRCMGHPSTQHLIHLPTVSVISPSLKTICDVCCRAKHTRTGITTGPDPEISSLASPPSSPTTLSPTLGRGKREKKAPSVLKDYASKQYVDRVASLSHSINMHWILSEYSLSASKPAAFLMEHNHGLALASGPLLSDPGPYRRLIGHLVYLTITRPDICYAVHVLSQFMQSPRSQHWDAALRVLRYLKVTPGQGLFLSTDSPLQIYAFCDTYWASCPLTRRSITVYFVSLGNSPISWRTKKQPTVSRSSAEAEYRSVVVTTCELTWLKSFLLSLGIHHDRPMRLVYDHQAALHIASNPVFHERTKHIEIDCHYVREHLLAGNISTTHVYTAQQVVDIFTKALGRHQFHYLCAKLGIQNLHAPT